MKAAKPTQISTIRVYQVDLPLLEGRYSWSGDKFVEVFNSTVVELITNDGLSGYGEVCPLGPFYLPAFGAGAPRREAGLMSASDRPGLGIDRIGKRWANRLRNTRHKLCTQTVLALI